MFKDPQKWADSMGYLAYLFLDSGKAGLTNRIFHNLETCKHSSLGKIQEVRAQIAIDLISHYTSQLDMDKSIEILNRLEKLEPAEIITQIKAQATCKIITTLASYGYFSAAENLLSRFSNLPKTKEIEDLEGRAITSLIGVIPEDPDFALRLYVRFKELTKSEKFIEKISRLTSKIIFMLIESQEYDRALKVYEEFLRSQNFKIIGHSSLVWLATVLANLVEAFLANGDTENAEIAFELLENPDFPTIHVHELKAMLSVNFIGECATKKDISKAEEIWNNIKNLSNTAKVKRQQLRAAVNYQALLLQNDLEDAGKALLLEIEELAVKCQIIEELAKATSNTIIIFAQKGNPQKAEPYLEKLKDIAHDKPLIHYYAKSLAHLVVSFFERDMIERAIEMFDEFQNLTDEIETIKPYIFFAANPLVRGLVKNGQLEPAITIVNNIKNITLTSDEKRCPELLNLSQILTSSEIQIN
ncbi:MAG: hypothetical protein LBE38_08195 [Deltaproteobacteria bacterium]|jgi:tetratricopeptide (TPR) repeat protein|nr:hypothetical protein [Deltaproteobacteria bacterium]